MKLNEIFKQTYTDEYTNDEFDDVRPHKGNIDDFENEVSSGKLLGFGADAVVRNTDDPHMVEKETYSIEDLGQDPYNMFVHSIYEESTGNPYLPRVYDFKVMVDPAGKVKTFINMEKLIPVTSNSVSFNDLVSLIKRMTKKDIVGNVDPGEPKAKMIVMNEFMRFLKRAIRFKNYSDITDEKLVEALQLLDKIYNKNFQRFENLVYDFHAMNAMFRRTPVGLQFVITDPFSAPK